MNVSPSEVRSTAAADPASVLSSTPSLEQLPLSLVSDSETNPAPSSSSTPSEAQQVPAPDSVLDSTPALKQQLLPLKPECPCLMNQAEAQRLLCISRSTLWRMRKVGILTTCKVGARVLFDPEDIADLVEASKTCTSRAERARLGKGAIG